MGAFLFVPIIDCKGEVGEAALPENSCKYFVRFCDAHRDRETFRRMTLALENSKLNKVAYVEIYLSDKFAERSPLSREDVAKLTLGRDLMASIWVWTYARRMSK